MNPEIATLKNGLRIICIRVPDTELVCLNIKGLVGSLHEKAGEIGCAHLAEHLLGSVLQNYLEKFNGKLVGITSREDVCFMVKVEKKYLQVVLGAIAKIFDPHDFSENMFGTSKKVILQEINRIYDNPEKLMGRISKKVLYPKTRMEILNMGEPKHLEKLTRQVVLGFIKRNYHPNNFVIAIAGDTTIKEVKNHFEPLKDTKKKNEGLVLAKAEGFKINFVKYPSIKQDHIRLDFYAFLLNEERRYSFEIVTKIFTDKVLEKIKKETGLAYQVNGIGFYGSLHANFGIYTAVEKGKTLKTLKIIKNILKKLEKAVTEETVKSAIKKIISERIYDLEKNSHKCEYYANKLLHANDTKDMVEENTKYENVTMDEIKESMDFLKKQSPGITIVSPKFTKSDRVYLEKLLG